MSFVYTEYLYIITLIIISVSAFFIYFDKRYSSWVKKHWYKQRTTTSKIAHFAFLISLSLFLLATLDLRGKEEQVETSIPDQKTIILIDNSLSMSAEDIRPSRFERAIMMARHFVQKAVGHQISIVVFSDIQKQIVPFTDDIDLLDSRLAGLRKKDVSGGGSNISQAIMESLQYFKRIGENRDIRGNLLIYTDSEEHGQGLDIKIKDRVSVAAVGVGTRSGAPIPRRGRNNNFLGYKQHNGKKVISKLNEDFLKRLRSEIKNYKYWVVTSYTMPTEAVLSFFKKVYKKRLSQGTSRVRPVKMEYLVIPAILFFILYVALTRFASFKNIIGALLLFFILDAPLVRGSDRPKGMPKENPLESLENETLQRLESGELNRIERLKVAEKLAKKGDHKAARILYEENIKSSLDQDRAKFNYGVTLLESGEVEKGIETLHALQNSNKLKAKEKSYIRQNILKAIKQEKSKKKQKGKKKNQKGKGKNKSKKKKSSGSEGDGGEERQKKSKKDGDKKDKKKNSEEQDRKQKRKKLVNKKPQSIEEKEEQIKKKRRLRKVPGLIKQIMDDDRQLQKKYIDTSTESNERNKKDW